MTNPLVSFLFLFGVCSFGSVVDLELGKVGEYFAHSGAREREVLDDLAFEQACKFAEGLREAHLSLAVVTDDVDALNLEASLKSALLGLLLICLVSVGNFIDCISVARSCGTDTWLVSLRVDERGLWNQSLNHVDDVGRLIVELLLLLLDGDGIALAIGCLQVVGRAKDYETTVDHDSNLIAKLLCFVHPVSRQEH